MPPAPYRWCMRTVLGRDRGTRLVVAAGLVVAAAVWLGVLLFGGDSREPPSDGVSAMLEAVEVVNDVAAWPDYFTATECDVPDEESERWEARSWVIAVHLASSNLLVGLRQPMSSLTALDLSASGERTRSAHRAVVEHLSAWVAVLEADLHLLNHAAKADGLVAVVEALDERAAAMSDLWKQAADSLPAAARALESAAGDSDALADRADTVLDLSADTADCPAS